MKRPIVEEIGYLYLTTQNETHQKIPDAIFFTVDPLQKCPRFIETIFKNRMIFDKQFFFKVTMHKVITRSTIFQIVFVHIYNSLILIR